MLRVSTHNSFTAGVDTMQRRQIDLSEAQQQLVSGKRVARPSDDPTAAARAERAMAAINRNDADQRALQASRNVMSLGESALGDASDLLLEARDAVLSAGNPAFDATQRRAVAQQLAGLRNQLLAVANRNDGSGGYLFGGQGMAEPPFIDAPGGVAYRATAGQQTTASDDPLPLALDGQAAWLGARRGNGVFETSAVQSNGTAWIDGGRVSHPDQITGADYQLKFTVGPFGTTYSVTQGGVATALTDINYAAGQAIELDGMSFTVSGTPVDGDTFDIKASTPDLSMFDVLDHAVAVLSDPTASPTDVTQAVQSAVRDLDASTAQINAVRADAGTWLNRIDGTESRLAGQKLDAQTERSDAEDLDMVQAVSEFQNKQTSYEAALKAYSMVQRLSLFQYLQG